jgi:hypothetical protein
MCYANKEQAEFLLTQVCLKCCRYSPFVEGLLAVAAAQNFGIVGNGRQIVVQVHHALCSDMQLAGSGASTQVVTKIMTLLKM